MKDDAVPGGKSQCPRNNCELVMDDSETRGCVRWKKSLAEKQEQAKKFIARDGHGLIIVDSVIETVHAHSVLSVLRSLPSVLCDAWSPNSGHVLELKGGR